MEKFSQRKQTQAAAQRQTPPTVSQVAENSSRSGGVVGKLLVISLIIVSIAVTAAVGYGFVRTVNGDDLVKSDQYQAVFLTDGQIYFGRLSNIDREYVELTDIYYLQVEQQIQPDREGEDEVTEDQSDQPRISLAKLGNELHGPEDAMFINSDQILFWENLKDEGQVVTAINEFVNQQGSGDN